MNIFKEPVEALQFKWVMLDYSCTNDFWDCRNKRSLSIEEAVAEGYFTTIDEAEEYKAWLEGEGF